jgi:uncharacterized protein YndB with AHSA1/START domain
VSTDVAARTVTHHSFTIERELPHAPARVFAAWADPKQKKQWFAAASELYEVVIRKQAFRPGGKERVRGEWHAGKVSDFQAVYFDIVPDRRIVYVYDMYVDEKKLSVSLATIEFEPAQVGGKAGTKLILTEQGAYFDDNQDGGPGREQGTKGLVEMLAKYLDG